MLHNKFHGNRSTSSGEEEFWRVFTIYGHGRVFGHVTRIMSINVHFLVPESLHIKFDFDYPSGFWEKQVLSFVCKWPWAKVKKCPWPSILTYVYFIFWWFQVTGCKCSEKSTVFTFSYRKACYQIWPCPKIGQRHSRVIIWTDFDGQESQMLHAKFRENRPAGSREENFEGFLPYMGLAAILVMWPRFRIQTRSPYPSRLHINFGFDWPSGFGEEDVWNCWRQPDDGQRTDAGPWVYYKLTLWA